MNPLEWLLAGALFASCCWMLVARQWMRLAFTFFCVLFLAAVVYVYAGAPWVGLTHLVLYVGGILILQLFGMMLTQRSLSLQPVQRLGVSPAVLLGFGVATAAFFALQDTPLAVDGQPEKRPVALKAVGALWMSEWLAGFELISLILLIALAGAATLARNPETETQR